MKERIKVLITVKTYPNISVKHDELVCTAGFREDGTWIRLFPIPYRKLDYDHQYKKYQWIELDVERNTKDFRPESYRPLNIEHANYGETIPAGPSGWSLRRDHCLNHVWTSFQDLLTEAKSDKSTSLAVYKPRSIDKFIIESVERNYDKDRLNKILEQRKQLNLFEDRTKDLQVVDKLPYKFSYVFTDEENKPHTLMIEDWEIGALYWNCLKSANGDETIACQKVKEKYWDEFILSGKYDIHLFLGTTLQYHKMAPQPFVIIGLFTPPIDRQARLF